MRPINASTPAEPLARRRWLSAMAALSLPGLAWAQSGTWPTKPVTLVVAAPPGGSSDNFARALGEELAKQWGQPVIVDNRPGAGGQLSAEYVARLPADGQVLLMSFIGNATSQTLIPRPNLDFNRDFTHITQMMYGANTLVAHPSTGFKTLQDFVRYAKANPGRLSYASSGNGTSGHLAMEMLKQRSGMAVVHIPYRGGAQALNDTLAGQIQVMFLNTDVLLPHIRTGKLVALAVSSPMRSPQLPEVPTVAESGYAGFEATAWGGLSGPKGLPPEVVQRIHSSVLKVLAGPFRGKQEALGATIMGTSPAEFSAHFRSEIERWNKVITLAGIKPD